MKLLESLPGDTSQPAHTDFDYNSIGQRVRSFEAFHYSALVAFETCTLIYDIMARWGIKGSKPEQQLDTEYRIFL